MSNLLNKFMALILCIFLMPVMLIITFCIVLEGWLNHNARGGVFFCESRISKGRLFKIFKFRTFYPSAMEEIKNTNLEHYGLTAVENKEKNLTKMGELIKKFYLDELPQIFNVIRGEMNFVGPRPLVLTLYEKHINEGNVAKEKLTAGWTGPWQIRKGRVTTFEDMVRVENAYFNDLKHLNAFQRGIYDLKIAFQSFKVICEGKSI